MVKKLSITAICLLAGGLAGCTTGPIGSTSINPATYGQSVERNFGAQLVEFEDGVVQTGPIRTQAVSTNRSIERYQAGEHSQGAGGSGQNAGGN